MICQENKSVEYSICASPAVRNTDICYKPLFGTRGTGQKIITVHSNLKIKINLFLGPLLLCLYKGIVDIQVSKKSFQDSGTLLVAK